MKLGEYVKEFFNGNKAEFARAFGRTPQHVNTIFNNSDCWRVFINENEHSLVQIKYTRLL